ncbi:DUF222 domain-containing protein [Actinomycetospora sp. CA-053990]|uniref:HNH endonuclease signature motif containing protein n=1 Tax=Actinomycetospora sp. CA-053990 TaxID=3239891 RepID=UPI003D8C3FF0
MSIDQDVRSGLAAELDALAPGVGLVDALERLSPAALAGEDLASYVRACARAQSQAAAGFLEAIHHLGRAQAGRTDRRPEIDEFSGDEVSAILGWSRTMSGRKLDLADDLFGRLPEVGDALRTGWLDEPKAQRFCEWTRDLADDHARHVCSELLPEAPELPVGELIRRIEETAAAIDPEWAKRRQKRAERNARVILSPNPSGTATLSICDVNAVDGLSMRDRVDALAAAVRGMGVLIPIGTLRAAVAARLLDGSLAGLDDRNVALTLAAEYRDPPPPEPDGGPGSPEDGPDDSRPDDSGLDDSGPDDGPDEHGPDEPSPDAAGPADGEAPTQGVLDLRDLPEHDHLPPMLDGPEPGPGRVRSGTSELRLRLSTALGLDRLPGTVPGYGTVLADDARALLRRHRRGEWRVVLTDDGGRLQQVLLARRRPRPRGPCPPQRPGDEPCTAIVELQVPTTVLAALNPHEHGAWAPLLAELQQRLPEVTSRLGHPPRQLTGDPARRRPRAEIDRWVRVRDRHCVAPGCRRPAHKADLDHTVDHALGGPTSPWNLGVWDRHHHRAKHHGGWRVRQPTPGRFEIRTRAGVHHTTLPKRILEPLPRPRPSARPRPLPDEGWSEDDPGWRQRFLRRTGSGTTTHTPAIPPAVHAADDPPPF